MTQTSADKVVLPALAVLVGAAVLLLTRKSGARVEWPSPLLGSTPLLGSSAPPDAPRSPSSPSSPTVLHVLEVTGPHLAITPGTHYLAKLQLTGFESLLGNADAVRGKFAELGFSNISVSSKNPDMLFPDREPYSSGTTFWASGTYSGASQSMTLPDQIKRVWVVA